MTSRRAPEVPRIVPSLIFFLVVGCGGPKRVEVRGAVVLDGKPLPGATVTLFPESGGRSGMGSTDDQGRFEIHTLPDGAGVLPGAYRVAVTKQYELQSDTSESHPTPPVGKKMREKRRNRLPSIYSLPATTPLRLQVPATDDVVLSLQSNPSK